MKRRNNRRAAFTLLEVMLVLLIIGLLVSLVAPAIFGMKEKADIDAARVQIGLIYGVCEPYRLSMNEYPASLNQLVENPQAGTKWAGPYMDRIPKDSWGHEFVYEVQPGGAKPLIFSLGKDGQPNTADDVRLEEAQ